MLVSNVFIRKKLSFLTCVMLIFIIFLANFYLGHIKCCMITLSGITVMCNIVKRFWPTFYDVPSL